MSATNAAKLLDIAAGLLTVAAQAQTVAAAYQRAVSAAVGAGQDITPAVLDAARKERVEAVSTLARLLGKEQRLLDAAGVPAAQEEPAVQEKSEPVQTQEEPAAASEPAAAVRAGRRRSADA